MGNGSEGGSDGSTGRELFLHAGSDRHHVLGFRGLANGAAADARLGDVQISAVGNAGLCSGQIGDGDERDVVTANLWPRNSTRRDVADGKRLCRGAVVRTARDGPPAVARRNRAADGCAGEGAYRLRRRHQHTATDERHQLAAAADGWYREAGYLLEPVCVLRAVRPLYRLLRRRG